VAAAPAPILAFETLDSTNAEARRRAEAGEGGPLWITAARQTVGKGRRGRAWSTQSGNLAATLLMTVPSSPAEAAQLSFVAALAVADLACIFVPPQSVRLKWPNDVMVNGLKVSGILIESGPAAAGLWLAIGIGVNLAATPQGVDRPAAALGDFMNREPPAPAEAARLLSLSFAHWLQVWQTGGFEPVRQAWGRIAQGIGEACIARLDRETVEGVAEGLEADGALRLRLADGSLRPISAGDVFFPGAA
jgi:BirA family biotin operon repressor/biotin-[acetyl-CoA-carboxylase] ligase